MDEIIGKTYGTRTAIEFRGTSVKGYVYLFRCVCGNEKVLPVSDLQRGKNTSCINCTLRRKRRERMEAKGLWPKKSS